jgi:hypothetical protein
MEKFTSGKSRYVDPFDAFKAKKDAKKNDVKYRDFEEKIKQQQVQNNQVNAFESHRFVRKELSPQELQTPSTKQNFSVVRTEEVLEKVPLLEERATRIENLDITPVSGLDSGRFEKAVAPLDPEKALGLMSHHYQKNTQASSAQTPVSIPAKKPRGFSKY